MPIQSGYNFHFFVQQLFCEIKLENSKVLKINWIDYDYYSAELVDLKTNSSIIDIELLGNKDIDKIEKIRKNVDIDIELVKTAIDKGNQLYQEFYG